MRNENKTRCIYRKKIACIQETVHFQNHLANLGQSKNKIKDRVPREELETVGFKSATNSRGAFSIAPSNHNQIGMKEV